MPGSGIVAGGPAGLLCAWKHFWSTGGAGLQAQGYLSMDKFANSESQRPASPASPPLACPRDLAAFGAPAVRFPWRGEEGSGCWHLLVRTLRLPSCSVEIMRVPACLFG